MQNKILAALLIFSLGYGSGLLTMVVRQQPTPTPVATLQPPVAKAHQDPKTPHQPTLSPDQRTRIFSQSMSEESPSQPESLFWQAMALVQHKLAGDSMDIDEIAMGRNAIDHLSTDELENIIRSYTKLAPHDYPPGVDVRDFAKRLGELYYRSPQDEEVDSAEVSEFVEFDSQVATNNMVKEPQESFSNDTQRIYASFDTSNYDKNSVMVKWSRVDSPEVLIYDKYAINTSTNHNYIWLERPDGWDSGDYILTVFSLEGNLPPLATGQYRVE